MPAELSYTPIHAHTRPIKSSETCRRIPVWGLKPWNPLHEQRMPPKTIVFECELENHYQHVANPWAESNRSFAYKCRADTSFDGLRMVPRRWSNWKVIKNGAVVPQAIKGESAMKFADSRRASDALTRTLQPRHVHIRTVIAGRFSFE